MLNIIDHVKKQLNITDNAFVGLFLYGSQNYGLSHEASDTDYICVVTNFDFSYTVLTTTAGQIKVYSLHYFLKKLSQGDLECLECLYSKHSEVNAPYLKFFNRFKIDISDSLNYESVKVLLNKKLAEHLSFIRSRKADDSSTARYSKKRLYWAIRVADQLERISAGETFESSLSYPEASCDELLKIKTIENYLKDEQVSEIEQKLQEISASVSKTEVSLLTNSSITTKAMARFKELEHLASIKKV